MAVSVSSLRQIHVIFASLTNFLFPNFHFPLSLILLGPFPAPAQRCRVKPSPTLPRPEAGELTLISQIFHCLLDIVQEEKIAWSSNLFNVTLKKIIIIIKQLRSYDSQSNAKPEEKSVNYLP